MKKILDRIDKPTAWFCKGMIFLMFLVIIFSASVQVFGRFVLKATYSWTDELCRYGMVWMTFIGTGYAVRTHGHIAVDLLKNFLPAKATAVIERFNDVCEVVLGAILCKYGMSMVLTNFTQMTPGLKISMGLVYSCIPIGGLLICIYGVANLLGWDYQEKSKKDVDEGGEI